jgi:hypothetical protein
MEPPGPSKGVALTNWLVSKTAGLLERKSSRRGFLIGSAMAGSAVAVAGCVPAISPGSPYQHITDCAGGLCTDGYTEFCCTINDGLNACPTGSFAGGWWRADFSSFCNGTRYYIDCMQNCCGPNLGNGFCAGCVACSCGGDCNTRRIYCNYFRYGQCHQEIGITGPIACRVVTCTPPYNDASLACTTTLAVDNSTAEHAPARPCTSRHPTIRELPSSCPPARRADVGRWRSCAMPTSRSYRELTGDGVRLSTGQAINSGLSTATIGSTFRPRTGHRLQHLVQRRSGTGPWSGWRRSTATLVPTPRCEVWLARSRPGNLTIWLNSNTVACDGPTSLGGVHLRSAR